MRTFLSGFLALLSGVFASTAADSPNVILIMCDDLGWGDVGFNGVHSKDGGKTFALYDLIEGPGETKDLSSEIPDIHQSMIRTLVDWQVSCKASDAGKDYR